MSAARTDRPEPRVEILTGWEGRDRLLAALDTALANTLPEHVRQQTYGDGDDRWTNRWSGTRTERYTADFSRADYGDGDRHGWLQVTRHADGRKAGLTALEDGRTEYWNQLTDEITSVEDCLGKAEEWAPKVDAQARSGSASS